MAVAHLAAYAFLNAVTPEVVIISLGAGNSYGHPHQEALDRISASGAQSLLRTDIDGTITLTSEWWRQLFNFNRKVRKKNC